MKQPTNSGPQQQDNNNNNNNKNSAASPLSQYSRPVTPAGGEEEDKSPFYKSAAPELSLPKGGGALKGIDEKFSVNPVNGTAGMELPLPFTPGRGGFTPAISLSYSSGGGNSVYGLGWSDSLPQIQRKTDKQLPLYLDGEESDVFVLAGAEDLVPVTDHAGEPLYIAHDTYIIKPYRPRIEGLFAQVMYIRPRDGGAGWWMVTTQDNLTTWYGLEPGHRIADPGDPSRVFSWLPSLVTDHKGNAQQFSYVSEDLDNVPHHVSEFHRHHDRTAFTNTYIKKISYGNVTPFFVADAAAGWRPDLPDTDWLFETVWDYGEHEGSSYEPVTGWPCRKDPFSVYRSGFEIRTYRRCRHILQFHYFPKKENEGMDAPELVRRLSLEYEGDTAAEAFLAVDYIVKAVMTGFQKDGDGQLQSRSLPPVTMAYHPLQWDPTLHKVAPEDWKGAPQGLTGPYQWTDFEGEGISGILTEQGSAWLYKNNLGDGQFAPPRIIAYKPNAAGLGQDAQWQDLDADGNRQLVLDSGAVQGFWELEPPAAPAAWPEEGTWEAFRTFPQQLQADKDSPYALRLDLNGDGRADLLLVDDRVWTWYEQLGKDGWRTGGHAPAFKDESKGPVLLLSDTVQRIFLADMTGDGLTDLVRIRNGEVCYWPNTGYGRFGPRVVMDGAPVFTHPDIYDPQYLTLADISGTGTADLIYIGSGSIKAWTNHCGNAWGGAQVIAPLPSTDAYSKISITDFLGNGTGCIVWSSPLPHHSSFPVQYIDLMGGIKPYLLHTYRNGMGKETSVTYKSSTRFYLEDKKQGISWATKLPFPVHCVASVTTTDTVSETTYTQSYRYRHGYYDAPEREFRGFGYVETVDTDRAVVSDAAELDQHPVLTKTWYHTGAWMRRHTLEDQYREEYFRVPAWESLAAMVQLPGETMDAVTVREAYRSVKGSPLRQEVYALDGSDKEGIPYSVTATAYRVLLYQARHRQRHAVWMNLQEQQLVWHSERSADDVRLAHELVLETDAYGRVLLSAAVAYQRHPDHIDPSLPPLVQDEQALQHITFTRNAYTNHTGGIYEIPPEPPETAIKYGADMLHYRLGLPYETIGSALQPDASGGVPELYTPAALKTLINTAPEVPYTDLTTPGYRVLSRQVSLFMDNAAAQALDFGELESLALPYESYTLVFDQDILAHCYGGKVTAGMLTDGKYKDLYNNQRFWIPSGTVGYSSPETSFYTPLVYRDPWGNETTVTYWDEYYLLPESITDPLGNVTTVELYSLYHLQPLRMRDINNNISDICYDALGQAVAVAVQGKADSPVPEGDTLAGLQPDSTADRLLQAAFWADPGSAAAELLQGATWRCIYDLDSVPVAVAMIGRTQHVNPPVLPAPPVETLIQITYTDGLGRVVMQKAPCEPTVSNDHKTWVGSGRTIYNNKGKPVMQFEPYFSGSHECDTAEQAAAGGVSPRLYYDALGRNYKTDLPDGSFTRTEWTAWEQWIWDNNDTVLESEWYAARINNQMGAEEKNAAIKAAAHADTPTLIHTDTLGRGIYTIRYLSPVTDVTPSVVEESQALDIEGNRLYLTDGRGLVPLRYRYARLQLPCYQHSMDSGTQYTLLDVSGQPYHSWDAMDRETEILYDALRRPLERKVTESTITKTLEVYVYGEGITGDKAHNLRGQIFKIYDGAGLVHIPEYDFKGNPLAQVRTYTDDATQHPDWTVIASVILETETYTTTTQYDALNRPVKLTTPDTGITSYTYDKGGLLKAVVIENVHSLDTDIVNNIEYDAKGQRSKIQYENGTTTTYEYDAFTFRVKRIRTTRHSDSKVLQDLHYWYDPVGNITMQKDDAQQTVYFEGTVAEPHNDYTYDALYRLIQAAGREHAGNNTAPDYSDSSRTGFTPIPIDSADTAKMRRYIQYYEYDAVGNFTELQHTVTGNIGNWTRYYTTASDSNRLQSTKVGTNGTPEVYIYDNRGNITGGMAHLNSGLLSMSYNAENRLERVIIDGNRIAYYQYDSAGQRVRKTLINTASGKTEMRKYIGEWEVFRKFDSSSLATDLERETLHTSDDTGRIALTDTRITGSGAEPVQLLRYQYSNHLQSATLELDDTGSIISYEEYYPYGSTSFQSGRNLAEVSLKRYRYTGKERDEETGLYYHGARYYIPWLCRWTAVDPSETKNAPKSSYGYCSNNPVSKFDPDGKDEIYFNYLYVKKDLIDTGNFNQYGVDSFHPQNFGVETSDYQVYKWMSVVKNDKPNTYHINKFSFDVNTDRSTNGPQKYFSRSISDERAQYVNPNSKYVPKDLQELYKSVSDFSGSLSLNYGSQISAQNFPKSQSQKNNDSVHRLLRSSEIYKENVEQQELESKLFMFTIELIATELLVLKLARGGSWLGRLGNDTIDTKGVGEIISTTLRVQKQVDEHIIGGARLGTNSYLNRVEDATNVLNAVHSGEARILSVNVGQNRVYVQYNNVTGYYNNSGVIIPTNKFLIKGGKSSTVVPIHPNSTTFK